MAGMLALTGCRRLSGTYQASDQSGDRLEFAGRKVYITIPPAPTMAGEYELADDKVIIRIAGEPLVLTRRGEDTLEGGSLGTTFTRR